jgi:hypothetical protein
MTHIEFKKEALYFHAQTLANFGEDVDNCFFKPVLEGNKPQIGSGRYIFLFKKELEQMARTDAAYFEFARRYDDGAWGPKSDKRELYKLVHNGYPDEHAIPTSDDGEGFAISTDELIMVMDYTPPTVNLNQPVKISVVHNTNYQTKVSSNYQPELNFQSLSSILDKRVTDATLGDLVEAFKTLR